MFATAPFVCLGIALLCLVLALLMSLVQAPHHRLPPPASPAVQAGARSQEVWQPLDLRITLVGPPGSGKTVYTTLALEQAVAADCTPHGFALAARDNGQAARILTEGERLRCLLRHQSCPASRTLQTTHLELSWASRSLAHITWTDTPSQILTMEPDAADPDRHCLTAWDDHLSLHTDVLMLMLPGTLLRSDQAFPRRRWQAQLHQVVLGWLRHSRAPHRRVVLAPSRVDDLAASLPEARQLLHEGAVRQLFGKVIPLLEARTGRDLDEWWVAPHSGFGFVPQPAWEFATNEPQPVLVDEPQPFRILPLLQGLVHEAALRRLPANASPQHREWLHRLCAALRADIPAQNGWLLKSVPPVQHRAAA